MAALAKMCIRDSCVRKMSLNAFIDHYQNWCKRKKYNFSQSKAEEIYGKAKELVPVLPKDALTKLIIKQAVDQLNSASTTVELSLIHISHAVDQLLKCCKLCFYICNVLFGNSSRKIADPLICLLCNSKRSPGRQRFLRRC